MATTSMAENLNKEKDDGNIEYKSQLCNVSEERLQHLITQMKYRYDLGYADDGEAVGLDDVSLNETINNVKRMAEACEGEATVLEMKQGKEGHVAEVLVRHYPTMRKHAGMEGTGPTTVGGTTMGNIDFGNNIPEVRIACCGNVDAGKSTLLGVLIQGELDNGRGTARTAVFIHKHELETGRTSCISSTVLGYDTKGTVVNYDTDIDSTTPMCGMSDVVIKSSKIISFFDEPGHEKYLKTTIAGLTGRSIDYTMMVVGGNAGVSHMTREHYLLTLAMNIPCFMVVTKSDMCPKNVLKECFVSIKSLLKDSPCHRTPLMITNQSQALSASRSISSSCNRTVPVFLISSVTGDGLPLLRYFLNLLPCPNWNLKLNSQVIFHIDEIFAPPGVGCVVSGILVSGLVTINQDLMLGPDSSGAFSVVNVKSIHYKRVPVRCAYAGQSCTFALRKIKRNVVRKGMVLLSEPTAPVGTVGAGVGTGAAGPSVPRVVPQGYLEFMADIYILHHSTTIHHGYQSVFHAFSIAQTVIMLDIKKKSAGPGPADPTEEVGPMLRSGDKARVRFRFLHRPEYLTLGTMFVFREGVSRGVGKVTELVPLQTTLNNMCNERRT